MSASQLYPVTYTVLVSYDGAEDGNSYDVGEIKVYADAEVDLDQIAASAYSALANSGRFTIKGTDASFTTDECKEFFA